MVCRKLLLWNVNSFHRPFIQSLISYAADHYHLITQNSQNLSMASPNTPLLLVSPTQLRLTPGPQEKLRGVVKVTNVSGKRVAFGVKANKPQPFEVFPTCGYLDAGQSKLLMVRRSLVPWSDQERFVVASAEVDPNTPEPERKEFWSKVPINQHICRVDIRTGQFQSHPNLTNATSPKKNISATQAQVQLNQDIYETGKVLGIIIVGLASLILLL